MASKADARGTTKLMRSPSSSSAGSKSSRTLPANYRTEEVRGYLFKKTRDGKWQKRWFETNGCFLTYYKKQGQKLLAALNLPQVGTIALLGEDSSDGPGLFTIELNERVYTIKARSQEEAAFWVDALLWRQAGGVVTQKSPDVSRAGSLSSAMDEHPVDEFGSAHHGSHPPPINPDDQILSPDDVKRGGCAQCCIIQ
ncbi:hypothetical protein Poli38472_009729 [Pythium oligandrum]|uniref:PH domain-containing protein n=1 Tax=Pythium oligandrum TaxID=41045 RepID=A0A8K1FH16_PYTOL|nr:hypothetical protein Poli38472_009729 [Pythium oligandrum]|eukprot:TMW62236.1 hypothetical protein Poli38472_009729 [Pythium oligandrum]